MFVSWTIRGFLCEESTVIFISHLVNFGSAVWEVLHNWNLGSIGRCHLAEAGDYSLSAGLGKVGDKKDPPHLQAVGGLFVTKGLGRR